MRKNVVAAKFEPEYYLARFRPAVFEYTGQAVTEWTVGLTGWYFVEARGAKVHTQTDTQTGQTGQTGQIHTQTQTHRHRHT